MKISIITTTYNSEKYIEETLESVLSQRGDFFIEYILYDANSTDSTFDIIKKYKEKVDSNYYAGRNLGIDMQIYQEADSGMYDGIAKGFRKVTGDVVAYINGDDMYFPHAFSTVAEVFSELENVNWVTGRSIIYNERGQVASIDSEHNYYSKLIRKGAYGKNCYFIEQESCFWRRSLLRELNFEQFVKYNMAGDFYLWHTFAKNNSLYTLNSCLGGFRCTPNQKSSDMNSYLKEFNEIVSDYRLSFSQKMFLKFQKKILHYNIREFYYNRICYDSQSNKWKIDKSNKNYLLKLFEISFITLLLCLYVYIVNGVRGEYNE